MAKIEDMIRCAPLVVGLSLLTPFAMCKNGGDPIRLVSSDGETASDTLKSGNSRVEGGTSL
jgi:hypothetical protein